MKAHEQAATVWTPVFPLRTVLCPGGRLPLQIFEPRYLTMLSEILPQDRGFSVHCIRSGEETAGPCAFHDLGTEVRVVDFQSLPGGLLGIMVEGIRRVRVQERRVLPDGRHEARLAEVPPAELEAPEETSVEFADLWELARELICHPALRDLGLNVGPDLTALSWRLTEWLPFALTEKQALLETDEVDGRLNRIRVLLHRLQAQAR